MLAHTLSFSVLCSWMQSSIKPIVTSEVQLLYLCHLFGPVIGRLKIDRPTTLLEVCSCQAPSLVLQAHYRKCFSTLSTTHKILCLKTETLLSQSCVVNPLKAVFLWFVVCDKHNWSSICVCSQCDPIWRQLQVFQLIKCLKSPSRTSENVLRAYKAL